MAPPITRTSSPKISAKVKEPTNAWHSKVISEETSKALNSTPCRHQVNLVDHFQEDVDISAISVCSDIQFNRSDLSMVSVHRENAYVPVDFLGGGVGLGLNGHSFGSGDSDSQEGTSNCQEITQDHLDLSYLRYLKNAYLDIKSRNVFNQQVQEAKSQLNFANDLRDSQMEKLKKIQQKTALVNNYHLVVKTNRAMKKKLPKLIGNWQKTNESLTIWNSVLEGILNQFTLEGIYEPENQDKYKDDIVEALQAMQQTLDQIDIAMKPLMPTINLTVDTMHLILEELQPNLNKIQTELENVCCLTLEEASLKIGAMNCSMVP